MQQVSTLMTHLQEVVEEAGSGQEMVSWQEEHHQLHLEQEVDQNQEVQEVVLLVDPGDSKEAVHLEQEQ